MMTKSELMLEQPSRRAFLGYGVAAGATALTGAPAWAQRQRPATVWTDTTAVIEGATGPGRLPGALAAIGRGNDALTVIARGTTANDSQTLVDLDTLWRLYSMTKPVTGIAAMQLIDRGRMQLDQPLGDILPAFRQMQVLRAADGPLDQVVPAERPITIRHLLTHTAGLGYTIISQGPIKTAYEDQGIVPGLVTRMQIPGLFRGVPAPSLEVFADRLARLPLVYQPGNRWSYSISLDLLGRVIEVVSGMPFDTYLRTRLFEPLGMNSTSFVVAPRDRARFTTNYGGVGTAVLPIDPANSSIYLDPPPFPFGGAGLVGSARDYDRFLLMLLNEGRLGRERVISQRTARIAMSNLLPEGVSTGGTFAAGQGFGAGGRVSIATSPEGEGIFGWAGAAGTIAFVDRRRQLRVGGYVQIMSQGNDFQQRFPRAVLADYAR
jgi:CubicO group peptidase (beta-lactamase class C family)